MNAYYKGQPIFGPRGPAGPDGNPIGTILSFMGLKAPKDYLVCDGAEYNISAYPALAAFFEEQFGAANYFGGDGETTFAVPDMRNLFLRGYHGEAEEQLSGEVGARQEATEHREPYGQIGGDGVYGVVTNFPIDFGKGQRISINVDKYESVLSFKQAYVKSTSIDIYNPFNQPVPTGYTSRPLNMAVLYCIKAVESAPAENVYSTEETRIGTWIDGKPLYRKSFIFSEITIGNRKSERIATVQDLDIETAANIYGVYRRSSDARVWRIGGQYTDAYASNGHSDGGVNGIFLFNAHAESTFTGVVTLEYTKTTD